MDQKTLKGFRERLLQRKGEILEACAKNKSYGRQTDEEPAQDVADQASNSCTREFLFSLSSAERKALGLVDEALARIAGKRFGYCVVCEAEMKAQRLAAVPWAKHCLRCQELQEQGLL